MGSTPDISANPNVRDIIIELSFSPLVANGGWHAEFRPFLHILSSRPNDITTYTTVGNHNGGAIPSTANENLSMVLGTWIRVPPGTQALTDPGFSMTFRAVKGVHWDGQLDEICLGYQQREGELYTAGSNYKVAMYTY